jgi:hypothetical protein
LTYEYTGNPHVHSPYSDGHGSHSEIALAAIHAGLDFVVVTDHNVWVGGMDGYRFLGDKRVLLLTGEEIHDQKREPQKNHLLVYETKTELSPMAPEPQRLIDQVRKKGGFSFIAHPVDPAAPSFDEPDLSWVDWSVTNYTGIELWNFMSEFKSHLTSFTKAFYYAYQPQRSAEGPFQEVLQRWDQLLTAGKRIVAIGGADAHATPYRVGPLKRVILPYEFLFKTVNTHVLTNEPLTGNAEDDRRRLFHSIANGRCFIGYDLPAKTHGFRFIAHGEEGQAIMGENIKSRFGITLQIKVPQRADIFLIRNGQEISSWQDSEAAVYTVTTPGAYRVEVYLYYKGKRRGWIFSNPIYVTN